MFSRVRVPASSANLGPGFDSLGLALGVYLECSFRPAAALAITVAGRDSELISTGTDNLIWQTALAVARDVGRELDSIELDIVNDIPLGKGLGSSAAALTAGVVIADQLLGLKWDAHKILDEAARIEGHPDNVAACVYGSIVASAIDSGGVARAVRLELPARFGIAVVVPDFVLPTSEARQLLPTFYSREDTVFNVQRSSLLVAALATGDTSAFPAALEDRMHQPYRACLVPGLEEMTSLRIPGLLGCALSGAGPSIVVFYERGSEAVCEEIRRIFKSNGHDSEILHADIATRGYELS
jgi:homoserine kinase